MLALINGAVVILSGSAIGMAIVGLLRRRSRAEWIALAWTLAFGLYIFIPAKSVMFAIVRLVIILLLVIHVLLGVMKLDRARAEQKRRQQEARKVLHTRRNGEGP